MRHLLALTACCCRLGALFSGRSADAVERLTAYGRGLGIAFQIADDLLDLIGEERTAGKSLGTDVEQQKLTLPLVHVLETGSPELATRVRQILGNPNNHKREALRPILVETGALAYAQRRAEQIAAAARAELSCLPASPCRSIASCRSRRSAGRLAGCRRAFTSPSPSGRKRRLRAGLRPPPSSSRPRDVIVAPISSSPIP